MSDFWKSLLNTFTMVRVFPQPCPEGLLCRGYAYEDDYGSWRAGCGYCGGSGVYRQSVYYYAGYFMKGVVDALWAHRAFDEGYSAGVSDCRA